MRISKYAIITIVASILSSPAFANDKTIRIGLIGFATNNSFTQATYDGMKDAAKDVGNVEIEIFDGAFDAQRQYNQLQDATATGRFDGFLIQAMAFSSIGSAVAESISAGMKVGAVHYPIGSDPTITDRFQIEGMTTFVGYNAASTGTRFAEATIKACEEKNPCRVGFLPGTRSAAQDVARIAAFEKGLEDHPEIVIVAMIDTMWSREGGLKATQDLLQANPNVDVIAGLSDQSIVGAEIALNMAGVKVGIDGGVRLIGTGGTITALNAVREGRWYATNIELAYEEGYLGTKNLVAAIREQEFDPIIDLDTYYPFGTMATKEILDAHPEIQSRWDG